MAVSYGFHALAIGGLAMAIGQTDFLYDPGGILGSVLILAIAATSFDRMASRLDLRFCKVLHGVGMYYLWLAFTYTFTKQLSVSIPFYLPFVIILGSAIILRSIGWMKWQNSRLT